MPKKIIQNYFPKRTMLKQPILQKPFQNPKSGLNVKTLLNLFFRQSVAQGSNYIVLQLKGLWQMAH